MTTDILLEPTETQGEDQIQALESAAALAQSGLFKNYIVYEKNGECWFGGDVARSITVYANRIERQDGEATSIRELTGDELCDVLAEELSLWSGQWQGFGWACFEFAYAIKTPHLLTEEERRGEVPLLYLCQPLVNVGLSRHSLNIVSENPLLRKQVAEIINNLPSASIPPSEGVQIVGNEEQYQNAVSSAVDQIQKGVLEKVILSRRLKLDFKPDFVNTWLRGRQENTPSRSFTMNLGGWQASGFSPEIVVSVGENGLVITEPLAGTCRRDGEPEADRSRFDELFKDPKETHEHAISVRLSVNEISEICEPASISVRQFMERKERGSVQHLGSTVCGTLRDDCNAWHAFASLFPAVTASGIPKREAFSEIRRLEEGSRGLYAGAIFKLDHSGALDAALVLRSLLGHKQEAWLQAGAGVVSASEPGRELTETTEKLSSVAPWVVKLD